MSIIDDLLAECPVHERTELEHVRQIIKQTSPDAEEVITYGMPGFKYKKKYLIAFGAFSDHLSIFPGAQVIHDFSSRLEDYTCSKGTIQFTLDHRLPDNLIRDIVTSRMATIDSA